MNQKIVMIKFNNKKRRINKKFKVQNKLIDLIMNKQFKMLKLEQGKLKIS